MMKKDDFKNKILKKFADLTAFEITSDVQTIKNAVSNLAEFVCAVYPLWRIVFRFSQDVSSCSDRIVWQEGNTVFDNTEISWEQMEHADNCISFPVLDNRKIYFQKQSEQGAWNKTEKIFFQTFWYLIETVTENKELDKDYILQSFVFNEIMDNMNMNLYISDIETDEILFMNKTMKRTFGIANPEGKVCWQVLQKPAAKRCSFCPIHNLTENDSITWEENNSKIGRVFRCYDSLMRWMDGRLVHFQQSVDITETKKLAKEATSDDLTGIFNRRTGIEMLESTLHALKKMKCPFTVCLYDLNNLKSVNDTYGHKEGDHYLIYVTEMVKKVLRPQDYMFRLSGDEFIVVFTGQKEQQAEIKMDMVLEHLQEKNDLNELGYPAGFCYGLFEIPPELMISIQSIISAADEKMYCRKRRFHSRHKWIEIEQNLKSVNAEDIFTFNKEYLYHALVESTDDYIYVCNMKTGTFRYPRAMVEEFGLPGEVIQDAALVWQDKIHEDDKQLFFESNREIAEGRTSSHVIEYRAKNRCGEWVWLRCRGRLERDSSGQPCLFAGFITNLDRKNRIDYLTGLYNKFEFEYEINYMILDKDLQQMAIIMLGIDELRHINDLYDRYFGDEVIRLTAQKIRGLLPIGAQIYRLDGDEFGIILRNGYQEVVEEFFSQIQKMFSRQQVFHNKKYFCTLSGGCVFFPEHGKTYLELIKYANYSLEYSKKKGKNRITFFSEKILGHKERSLELAELLRESIENNYEGFELYYQPQVRNIDQSLIGAEALARWKCEKYGYVPPMEFIPLLEENGLILKVGQWIFEQAVKACQKWSSILENFTISINLSYLQLEDPAFIGFMQTTLEKYKVSPIHIVVELTESYIASNIELLTENFRKIRSLGIKIAMDDFGTGYSSLGILKLSPADIVKIDRAFVKDIKNSTFDITFIKFVVELCHDVGIQVCLEGIETLEEYCLVTGFQIDFIQGYYFGKPMAYLDFENKYFNRH